MIQDRRHFFRLGGFFIFALALHLAGTWILPLVDRDETWYAEVSREMNQRDDYTVAYYNNTFWLEKPPMLYWGQSLAYKVFGSNEFGARFPGALASALTALVIFGFCARLYGQKIAWRAAFAFTLCLEMIIFGKAGVTDMPAVLFVTLAAWAGWELVGATTPGAVSKTGWWWIFYASLAAIFLAKGPLAILPVGGLAVYWFWTRVPGFFSALKFVRGFLVTGVLVALWFVPAVIDTHGEYLRVFIGQQVFQRSVKPMDGHGASNLIMYIVTLPFYLVTAFVLFFPWSIYFPAAFRRLRKERLPADIYLVSGILVTFTIFSLVRTKLPHYTLPAYPLLACAIAPVLASIRFARWAVVMVALNLAISFVAFPLAAKYSVINQLANDPSVQDGMAFASVDYHEPGLVWTFRKHLQTWHERLKVTEVATYMNQAGARLCILPTKFLPQVTVAPDWHVVNARGFNITKGRMIELTMLVKSK